MVAPRSQSRSLRRLSAGTFARREKRAAARRRGFLLGSAGALAIVLAAPLSIASFMGLEASIPGFDSAKSFLAMMTDRSPGDRTKGELTKLKQTKVAAPRERALGKITKPEPPKEFLEAIAPPPPKLAEPAQFAPAVSGLGPLLAPPPAGGGGGIVVPPQAPPPGGGGGTPPTEEPPTEQPPTEEPPPAVPEPATWASMLLGFGLTGFMIRRRRRSLTAVVPG
jgi:hypothetical protein